MSKFSSVTFVLSLFEFDLKFKKNVLSLFTSGGIGADIIFQIDAPHVTITSEMAIENNVNTENHFFRQREAIDAFI
jgi:hypothetical protein